jgi:hypothetical protein
MSQAATIQPLVVQMSVACAQFKSDNCVNSLHFRPFMIERCRPVSVLGQFRGILGMIDSGAGILNLRTCIFTTKYVV